jgi:hypothetical protein
MWFGLGAKSGSEARDASDRIDSSPGSQSRIGWSSGKPRIPLVLKILLTAFVCVLVPTYYRTYGPADFLYICDVSLFTTLLAVWLESPLLISMQLVATLVPQGIWLIDFLAGLCGLHPLGVTDYMFNPALPLFSRVLSLFHGWLPLLLLWLVKRVGYDRRALLGQSILGVTLMLTCYFVSPLPGMPSDNPNATVNVNYVFGTSSQKAQAYVDPRLWLLMMCGALVVVGYLPAHAISSRVFARPVETQGDEIARAETTAVRAR